MNIILLEKVHNLGDLGNQVKVKPGYGRNYLIPSGKAVAATEENIKLCKAKQAELGKQQKHTLDRAAAKAEKMRDLTVTISSKAGAEGKLFGSVGTVDIAAAATAAGVELARQAIRLPQGSLRATGEYDIEIQLHADVTTTLKVNIVAEES